MSLVAISSTCFLNTKAIELMSEEAMLESVEQVMAEVPYPAEQPGGARKIDIREYLSDVCDEIDNIERHENQCGLLESAIAFRMSTVNRIQ